LLNFFQKFFSAVLSSMITRPTLSGDLMKREEMVALRDRMQALHHDDHRAGGDGFLIWSRSPVVSPRYLWTVLFP
jgi:hypothetical protein